MTFGPGLVGQAFLGDGVNLDSAVFVPNSPSLDVSAGDFTVDAWVYFNKLTEPGNADMAIVSKMNKTGADENIDGWRLLKQTDGHFWFCFGGSPSSNGCGDLLPTTVKSTTSPVVNTWYHVAGVKSSTEIAIYVNGVKEGSKPLPAFTDSQTNDLYIGSQNNVRSNFDGLIDEVELYNRALSGSEIQSIVNAGSAGKCKIQTVTISLDANKINPKSNRELSVSVLSSSTFDATTIDPTTVLFGATGTEATTNNVSTGDVNGDGLLDETFVYHVRGTGISCSTTSVTITGKTTGGQMFSGTIPITTVGCP